MAKNPYYSGPVTDHFDGTRFYVGGVSTDRGLGALLRWQKGARNRLPWPEAWPSTVDTPPARVEGAALRVSYVGHATMLIQTQGLNILVDPVWSERASPVSFAGPRRVVAPGIALDDLPPLDVVLVSHSHYDHMDSATLMRLIRKRPVRVLTPLGNDTILRGFRTPVPSEAFDWGARVEVAPGVAVHFEPAQHWAARGVGDRRMSLWASFVIETPAGKILHIADTGYGDGAIFRQMRAKHGPMRLAILPIGAYAPRWFMRAQHVDPEESVQIFRDVGAAYGLAHHWGTFRLTDEAIDEPPKRLADALAQTGIAPGRFVTRRPGEVFDVPDDDGSGRISDNAPSA